MHQALEVDIITKTVVKFGFDVVLCFNSQFFLFQVCVEQWVAQWAGGLAIGVTCMAPSDKAPSTIGGVKEPTWYIMGKFILYNSFHFHN